MDENIRTASEAANGTLRELEELRQRRLRSIAAERADLDQAHRGLRFQGVLMAQEEATLRQEEQMLNMVDSPEEPPAREEVAQEPPAPEAPQPVAEDRGRDEQPAPRSEPTVVTYLQENKLLLLAAAIVFGVIAFFASRWIGLSIADMAVGEVGLSQAWMTVKNLVITVLALAIGFYVFRESKNYLEDSAESS